MKVRRGIYSKAICPTLLWGLLLVMVAGCQNRAAEELVNGEQGLSSSDRVKVDLVLGVDQFDGLLTTMRVISPEQESKIATLKVLSFSVPTSTTAYDDEKYFDTPEILSGPTLDGNHYKVSLQMKPGRQRLVFLANVPGNTLPSDITIGMTKKQVYDKLVFPFSIDGWKAGNRTGAGPFDPIPMWGESNVGTLSFGDYFANKGAGGAIRLYRSFARIDVGFGFKDPATPGDPLPDTINDYDPKQFPLKDPVVILFHPATTFRLAGDMRNISHATYKVTAPTLPTPLEYHPSKPDIYDLPGWFIMPKGDYKGRIVRSIYVPETPSPSGTRIILDTDYEGAECFYNLDFSREVGGQKQSMPLLRNKRYRINITNATKAGYPTVEEALNAGSN